MLNFRITFEVMFEVVVDVVDVVGVVVVDVDVGVVGYISASDKEGKLCTGTRWVEEL